MRKIRHIALVFLGRIVAVLIISVVFYPVSPQAAKKPLSVSHTSAVDNYKVNLVGQWANGPCRTATAVGDTVYFGGGGYLLIADFTDPASPVDVGKVTFPHPVMGIAVRGNLVYWRTRLQDFV